MIYTQVPSTCPAITSTAWSITTTSTDNPASVSSFQTISALGVFTAIAFTSNSVAGTYTVQVNQITLAGDAYTPTGTTSFVLTVTDPCLTTSFVWVISPKAMNCTVGEVSTNGIDPHYTQ
jgi:hypothetical protein